MTTELIEQFATLDVWCEGLARIDQIGPCRRLLFFASDSTAPKSRVVTAKLILPADVLADIAQMITGDLHRPPQLAQPVARRAN